MKPLQYRRAGSTRELATALSSQDLAYAGGTDLLPRLRSGRAAPRALVDIKHTGLPARIRTEAGTVELGALATLAQIEEDRSLAKLAPLLREAVAQAATPQIRARATVAGNLLQRPRCAYYRDPDILCWLGGGETCHARTGRNEHHAIFDTGPCRAVHPSDLAPALIALDARVAIDSPRGMREESLADLYRPPREDDRRETRLAHDDWICAVRFETPPPGSRSGYEKAMDRQAWAFALVSAAATMVVADERVRSLRVVLGGVANLPWRLHALEQRLAGMPAGALFDGDARMEAALDEALSDARPLAESAYKLPLARALVTRLLQRLARP